MQPYLFAIAALTLSYSACAQTLLISLNELLSSFLDNPTVISDFAPLATESALLATFESYVRAVEAGSNIPTAPPAFITSLPIAAQKDLSEAFSIENSIISANGGLSANSLTPLPQPSLTSGPASQLNTSMTATGASVSSVGANESTTIGSPSLTSLLQVSITDTAASRSTVTEKEKTSLENLSSTSVLSASGASSTALAPTGGAMAFPDASYAVIVAGILVGVVVL